MLKVGDDCKVQQCCSRTKKMSLSEEQASCCLFRCLISTFAQTTMRGKLGKRGIITSKTELHFRHSFLLWTNRFWQVSYSRWKVPEAPGPIFNTNSLATENIKRKTEGLHLSRWRKKQTEKNRKKACKAVIMDLCVNLFCPCQNGKK